MKRHRLPCLTALTSSALVCTALGCDPPAFKPRFDVTFVTRSDQGVAVEKAQIFVNNRLIGETATQGKLRASLEGRDGTSLRVRVACPARFSSPHALPELKLAKIHRLMQAPSRPEMVYEAICTRQEREVLIVVQTENGTALPVIAENAHVGTTSERGTAHILLNIPRQASTLKVKLDTSEAPLLNPKHPERVFDLETGDNVLVFAQTFRQRKKRRVRRAPPPEEKHVPYRLD